MGGGDDRIRTLMSHGTPAVDLESFWAANDAALRDPFSPACAQMPMGIAMSDELVFDELGVAPEWYRLFHDGEYHAALCRRYNDRAEAVTGRRLVPEQLTGDRDPAQPEVKTLADIFEARSEWREESWSWWLNPSAGSEDELSVLLDRVERRLERLRDFLLPEGWGAQQARRGPAVGQLPAYRGQRGPVTFATSVYGAENLVYLILDNPDLAGRFRDLILKAILERARIIDEERGSVAETDTRTGWSWEYIDDYMTIPRLEALNRHWGQFPPVCVSINRIRMLVRKIAEVNYKIEGEEFETPKPKDKKIADAEWEKQFRDFGRFISGG